MLDAYTESVNTDRWYDVMQWCQSEFGQEAWPLHGIEGQWHVGGATIHGWTWIGFATEEMMTRFSERWHNATVDLPDTAAQDSASKSNNPAVSG